MWNKVRVWFRNSVTILWARVQVLAGVVVACLMALASDPNVTANPGGAAAEIHSVLRDRDRAHH
jgi:hypothetical protein